MTYSHIRDRGANGNGGGKWIRPTKRWRIYDRDGWRCVWCQHPVGTTIKGAWTCRATRVPPDWSPAQATLDHVVPRSRGRTDNHESNLVTCCLDCNDQRKDSSAVAWAFARFGRQAYKVLDRLIDAMSRPLPPSGGRAKFLASVSAACHSTVSGQAPDSTPEVSDGS